MKEIISIRNLYVVIVKKRKIQLLLILLVEWILGRFRDSNRARGLRASLSPVIANAKMIILNGKTIDEFRLDSKRRH